MNDLELRTWLNSTYQTAVENYIKEFLKRHDFEPYDPENWIGDVGGVYECADMFIDFADIKFDIDYGCTKHMFEQWYWDALECTELGISFPNYKNWSKGAPAPSQESIQKIKNLKQNLEDLILIENNKINHG